MHYGFCKISLTNFIDLVAISSNPLAVSPKVLIIEFISSFVTGERNTDS